MWTNSNYITIDGLDGIGKSTQLALLKQHLDEKKIKNISTRALGGPVDSEIDKLRTFLFQNQFSPDTEEDIIELIARLNIKYIDKEIKTFYSKNYSETPFYTLQDRGILSHFCYGKSKGIARNITFDRFYDVLAASKRLKSVNIALVPKDINMILKRIENRGHFNDFHNKYETFEVQKKVYENILYEVNIRNVGRDDLTDYGKFHLIEVDEADQPLDVHKKVLEILKL